MDFIAHSVGTSNAAALVSRNAALCCGAIIEALEDQVLAGDRAQYVIPLLKSLLIHGSSWGEMGERLTQIVTAGNDPRQVTSLLRRWLGYGSPDFTRVLGCTLQRATVLGFGSLEDGKAHVFRLPLPPSLSAKREWRRLTVSLAWMSPIASSTQKYRAASLWFDVNAENGIKASRIVADWQAVRRGTLQHEAFEGERALPLADGDSLAIQVNCRRDAVALANPVPYGIAVSLEVAEGVDVPIYEEIRDRIAVPVQIRQQTGGSMV